MDKYDLKVFLENIDETINSIKNDIQAINYLENEIKDNEETYIKLNTIKKSINSTINDFSSNYDNFIKSLIRLELHK